MSQKEERWIEFEACRTIDDDDKVPNFDIFGDPDPYETFDFNFQVKSNQEDKSSTSSNDEKIIKITLKGFKHEHERIFDSTGLTLWRASKLLCEFMCSNPHYIENKTVLEIGAGLGLCGLLAYHLKASSVVMTDGDTDVLSEMRSNVDHNLNHINSEKNSEKNEIKDEDNTATPSDTIIPCRQLRWGEKYIQSFKENIMNTISNHNGTFDVIIASDVVYVDYILDDLFDTIVGLLSSLPSSKFLLAYARRAVDINAVYECATQHGLIWTEPENTEGVYIFSRHSGVDDIINNNE